MRGNLKRKPFNAYVLDQLRGLEDVECRPMFGCFGLSSDAVFFAIICDDRLFFRTDDVSRQRYIKMGMVPLQFREKQSVNSYYEVPDSILKSADKVADWARTAIQCQRDRLARKEKRAKR